MDYFRRLELIENISRTKQSLRDRCNPMEDHELEHRFLFSIETIASNLDIKSDDFNEFYGRGGWE